MNRENKKRKYDRRYFRTHPCTDSFTCKNCGWPVVSAGAGSSHRNHCPNCLYTNPDDAIYCAKCGIKLDMDSREFYEQEERREAAEAVDEAEDVVDTNVPDSQVDTESTEQE